MKNNLSILIAFLFIASCNVVDNGDSKDTIIPDGAIWHNQTLKQVYTPNNFNAVLGWLQAATITPIFSNDSGIIYVDYMKLIEVTSNIEKTVYFEDYNMTTIRPLNLNEGGLYKRFPKWFVDNSHTKIMSSSIENGVLKIIVSDTPDRIVHWWTSRVKTLTNSKYLLEIKVKIKGKISLQLGSDFWRELDSPYNGFDPNCITSNNCEAWISDWYSDTNDEFIIIKAPK